MTQGRGDRVGLHISQSVSQSVFWDVIQGAILPALEAALHLSGNSVGTFDGGQGW